MGVGVERIALLLAIGESLMQVTQMAGHGLLKIVQMHGSHHTAGQKRRIVSSSIAKRYIHSTLYVINLFTDTYKKTLKIDGVLLYDLTIFYFKE